MDDNTNRKKAQMVDSSNDVNPDPQQEGETPYPFNMEDKRAKEWILIYSMLGIATLLKASFVKPLSNFPPPRQFCGLVMQSNSTRGTATKQAHKVNSNDVDSDPDEHGENSQKEALNHKRKAPGPSLQASNGPNW